MMYEVGDKVEYKNSIFIMYAEILEVLKEPSDDYKYYISYMDYEGENRECFAREKDLVGFVRGTEKYLRQKILKLLEFYPKNDIVKTLYDIVIDEKSIVSVCSECGSSDISIEEEIDYDYEENPYTLGYYLQCNCCGNLNQY